jgi:hypothetical protein
MDTKRTLQGRADGAYCNYIRQLQQPECLGHEYKLAHGQFGEAELKAHCKAAEQLGAHRAFADAARDLVGWISTAQRLPELHVAVALLDENRWMNTGVEGFDVNWQGAGYLSEMGQKYWSVFGQHSMTLESITHWMPLPAAPSAES